MNATDEEQDEVVEMSWGSRQAEAVRQWKCVQSRSISFLVVILTSLSTDQPIGLLAMVILLCHAR